MTTAPRAQPLTYGTLEDATRILRERGLRLSTTRRLLLHALFAAEGPVSAERIARASSMEPASVYRNLETLERHGVVRHVHLGHGPGLYVLVGRGEHEYLFCEQCGAVKAIAPEQLDAFRRQLRRRFGYHARFTHFAIVGLCPQCSGSPDSGTQEHTHSHGDHVHSHPHARGPEDHHEHDD